MSNFCHFINTVILQSKCEFQWYTGLEHVVTSKNVSFYLFMLGYFLSFLSYKYIIIFIYFYTAHSKRVFINNKATIDKLQQYARNGFADHEDFLSMVTHLEQHQPCLIPLMQFFEDEGYSHKCPQPFQRLIQAIATNYPVCGLVHQEEKLLVSLSFRNTFGPTLVQYNKFLGGAAYNGWLVHPCICVSLHPSVQQSCQTKSPNYRFYIAVFSNFVKIVICMSIWPFASFHLL